MVFIIDAHLLYILLEQIEALGYEAIHTSDMEMGENFLKFHCPKLLTHFLDMI